jgi:hypothetical protein
VFTRIGGQRYTTTQVLAAEQRVLAAAGLTGGPAPAARVQLALARAGAGKATALGILASVWSGLEPSLQLSRL